MAPPKKKGTKMSIAEFNGGVSAGDGTMASVPSGPRDRPADADGGSYRKGPPRRDDDGGVGQDYASRADGDSKWRRGGGASASGDRGGSRSDRGGFSADRYSGGADRYGNDRGGSADDRRGSGVPDRGSGSGGSGFADRSRSNFADRGGSGFGDKDRQGTGYERRGGGGDGFDRDAPRDDRFRRAPGGNRPERSFREDYGRGSADGGPGPIIERTRLNLVSNRKPEDSASKPSTAPVATSPSRNKPNPFGSASAVDTATRLAALELKQKEKEEAEKVARETENAEKLMATRVADSLAPAKDTETGAVEQLPANTVTDSIDAATSDDKNTEESPKKERRERTKREPQVVNSRAAGFGEALTSAPKRESNASFNRRERPDREQGPPPVLNERFAKLAEEEKEKTRDRDDRRTRDFGPPIAQQNSRFTRAVEADSTYIPLVSGRDGGDIGPPLTQNSRFAAAADADQSYNSASLRNKESMGPPPIQNSRFAAVAEAELFSNSRERDLGPPPVQNSRFAAAAETDQSYNSRDRDLGPPVPQNSRFAAAAAEFESERNTEMRERDDRRGDSRGDPRDVGPPPIQRNTRFTAAAAEAELDRERENIEREERRMARGDFGGDRGGSFGGGSGGGRYGDDRGGGHGDRYGGDRSSGSGGRFNKDRGGGYPGVGSDGLPTHAQRTDLTAPEMPKHLQPKKEPESVLPPVEAPLTLPGEDEAAAKARIERKKREAEEKAAAERKAAEEVAAVKEKEERLASEKIARAAAVETDLLEIFASGKRLGSDLAQWCADQGAILPSVEKLVCNLLIKTEKEKPDPECSWAQHDKYGAALLSLVEDNVGGQTQVLWGIQRYCNIMGFPKFNNEYLVQAMFRAMYKYDLASAEGFAEWKEDETDDHAEGKKKAIIQTMDWFTWLDADDDDDDEDDSYEEDEEYEE